MFYKDPHGVYRASELDELDWLQHGFSTRTSNTFGHGDEVLTLRQIHSDICVIAGEKTGCVGEGDALLGNRPGQLLCVKTADCLPILLIDEQNRAAAAVHAGWRGTLLGIVAKAVTEMGAYFGTQPSRLHAALGPAIGPCCFDVGPEVALQFGAGSGRAKLDLRHYNRLQLLEAGVPASLIYSVDLCTRCEESEFYSYRRDKEQAGRMLSGVGLK